MTTQTQPAPVAAFESASGGKEPQPRAEELGDFTATPRVIPIALIAIVIGIVAAFVAYALLELINLFTNAFYFQRWSFAPASPAEHTLGAASIAVPVVGALVIGLMARFGSERIRGHGIPEALEAILVGGSKIEPKIALLKPISSAISIGSGGPFGAEGPIIMTGGAFGSIIAQLFKLTAAERKTLLVAGAAAGMSATFATPLAAILIAVELLLFEYKPRSFVPVALASAVAATARHFVLGAGPLFPVAQQPAFAGVGALAACAAAGLLAGALSGALTVAVYAAEDAFKRLPIHWMWWPALGGLAIGIGGLICPSALGVGYATIGALLREDLVWRAVLVLVLVKGAIWSISLGSGTSGGVLAPLLMMGAALGGVESHFFPHEALGFWPLVSMGAILGGTMRSPLTGIVFAVELTHEMNMILPLAVAVTVAHAFTVLTLRRSILTEKVARRDFHVSREYAVDVLEILLVRDVMNTTPIVLSNEMTVVSAVRAIGPRGGKNDQELFPVLDQGASLVGTVMRDDLERRAREPSGAECRIATFVTWEAVTVASNETLRTAVHRMAEAGVTRVLSVNPSNPKHLVGKLALHDVLKARTRQLADERRRERVLPWERIVPGSIRGAMSRMSRPDLNKRGGE